MPTEIVRKLQRRLREKGHLDAAEVGALKLHGYAVQKQIEPLLADLDATRRLLARVGEKLLTEPDAGQEGGTRGR